MKGLLIKTIAAVLILTGCNNGDTKEKGTVSTEKETEAVSAMLTDISKATDIKTLLSQNWEDKEDAQEAVLSGGSSSFEMPYRGFSFFTDNTLVQNPRDNIRFGNWTLDEPNKIIDIVYADGSKAQYKIAAIGVKSMVLVNNADKKRTEYQADGKVQKNVTDDPFYSTNNLWRKKPARAESDSAIKLRALQCVLFYSKFLDDNVARAGNTISFIGLPTCFKWYAGGITVTGKEKLEEKWVNCFYNKEQAFKAQVMLENIITKKYKWNKEEPNWVKMDADVIKQIYDTLQAAK
jgi:hypothetical protein